MYPSYGTSDKMYMVREAKRSHLLEQANWTKEMEFELSATQLNQDMLTWLRVTLASDDELKLARSHQDFHQRAKRTGPLTALARETRRKTEEHALAAFRKALERARAGIDHSIEEDDDLLAAHRNAQKKSGWRAAGTLLPPRAYLAIT